jgi:hypothetical protein
LWKNPENLSDNQQIKLAWIAATDPRLSFGFKSPEALIALALLSLGGHRPALPGRN